MRILFCTAPQGPPEATGYDHGLVALAEGLEEINRNGAHHQWSGTVPYWRRSAAEDDWLIPADGQVSWDNADLIVVSYLLLGDGLGLPRELAAVPSSTKRVFLDAMDGWRTYAFQPVCRPFDLVLRCHLNARYPVPENVRPWAFGLTNRIVGATDGSPAWVDRSPSFQFNFRVGHPLRDWARNIVVPGLEQRFAADRSTDLPVSADDPDYLNWAQTGRRHVRSYYERLKGSSVGATYGGYFAPDLRFPVNSPVLRLLFKGLQTTRGLSRTIVQFDSWRLWETLAAGALAIHVDLEEHGAKLPVPLVNRTHYWAISPHRWKRDVAELLEADSMELAAIADAGRRFVLEYYSPQAQVERLLALVSTL